MQSALLLAIAFVGLLATGSAQTLSLKFGTPFKRSDLDVRWKVTNSLPAEVWSYKLLSRRFSEATISNLVALGPFESKDLAHSNATEMLYKKSDQVTSLWVSFRLGAIRYQIRSPYGPTNLAQNVLTMADLPQLTTNFLREIGIDMSEVSRKSDGSPDFHYWEPFTEYFINHAFVTNIEFRAVNFRRAVDSGLWIGGSTGGDGRVQFGPNGKPTSIWLSWRTLERDKKHATASPELIIKWIRQGKAVQGMIVMGTEPINWKTVKSATITKAEICYYAGDTFDPSDALTPLVALWTTVDTGHDQREVEIDCPIMAD